MEIPVESGYDIRTVQELLGHRDMKTTIDLPGLIWSRTNVRLDRNREVTVMPRKRYTPEEVIQHLRTVELDTGKGLALLDACRKLGITEQTYYRWKKEYGGLRVDQAKRLKSLEQENTRLKRIVADLSLDNSILKEVASGNFEARPASARPWGMPSSCSTSPSAGRVGRLDRADRRTAMSGDLSRFRVGSLRA